MMNPSFTRSRRWLIYSALTLTLAVPAGGFAQQPETAPAQQAQQPETAPAQQAQQAPAATANAPTADQLNQRDSTGGDLAAASNQAAQRETKKEEGVDYNAFKYSPAVAWFGKRFGMEVHRSYWAWTVIDFVLIAGAILWMWKKAWPSIVAGRNQRISRGMEEARRASDEARARLSKIEDRLSKLDAEIAGMRSQAETEARAEEKRVQAAAEEEKTRILAATEQEISSASAQARRELKKFAAEVAVSIAQAKLAAGMNSDTDKQLIDEFAQRIGREGHA